MFYLFKLLLTGFIYHIDRTIRSKKEGIELKVSNKLTTDIELKVTTDRSTSFAMSKKGSVLFLKGQHSSQSEVEEEDDDVWDDRKINDAYDKAMKMAGAEVAKRLAMSTNSKAENVTNSAIKKTTTSKKTSKPRKEWKAGMSCRAVYYKDGFEYEAMIQEIIDEEECYVKFLGYDNSEIVALSSLKSSRGVQAQAKQIRDACHENGEDCNSSSSFEDMKNSSQRNSGQGKKHNKNLFELPEVPLMPNMSMFKNMGMAREIPMPPPPPPPIALQLNSSESENQVMSSMLLSWYMSGYYSGLYQASKINKKN